MLHLEGQYNSDVKAGGKGHAPTFENGGGAGIVWSSTSLSRVVLYRFSIYNVGLELSLVIDL